MFLAAILVIGQAAPVLITDQTRQDSARLKALQTTGKVIFSDDFENPESLKSYFEVRGAKEGWVKVVDQSHSGKHALACTARNNNGASSGSGVSYWFGEKGYERVYLRYYIKFKEDYNQGNLNHTGVALTAAAGDNKWRGMGTAGIRPKGDDCFSASFESWCDWGRIPPPGYAFFYTYWMEMGKDKDGNYWGTMLGPKESERFVFKRGTWTCCELMIKCNTPGKNDGELAAWIEGKLYVDYTGLKWRSSADVLLKRFGLDAYVHSATKDNTVYYDDVVLSTGYVGPRAIK
ncbi:MAG: polysaccharide lyase [Fimbriimonadaceae bacterium]